MEPRRLAPDEEIPGLNGTTIGDFWSWAYSDILLNTTRGVFAEFLVGTALGVVGGVRSAWDSFDLLYERSGIEVKSSAYIQSWHRPHDPSSSISWGIEERFAYDAVTDTWGDTQTRSAECYVFCLYTERVRESADVLDLNKWRFYVLSTKRINSELGMQKRVSLGTVKDMTDPVGYAQLKEHVDRALSAD
jgi:hypothetical protein